MFFTYRKIVILCFSLTLVFSAGVFVGSGSAQTRIPDEVSANKKGLAHFKHGYYDLTPKGRKAEAREELDKAEKAFLKAIALNSNFVDAHRNLARLYNLQGKLEHARYEYAQALRLDPDNIDNYLQMASVETKLENFQEAIHYLEAAKQHTNDEQILNKLESFIQQISLGAENSENKEGGKK